jgi:hypothetical protein
MEEMHYQNDLTPSELGTELSDVELLRRAVAYSRPYGFNVIERWREVASLFGLVRRLRGTCAGGSASIPTNRSHNDRR